MEFFLASTVLQLLCQKINRINRSDMFELEHCSGVDQTWKNFVAKTISETPHRISCLEILDYHGQLQTAVTFSIKNSLRLIKNTLFLPSRTKYERELVKLSDGGTIALDWVIDPSDAHVNKHTNKPIVLMLHGLVGDSQSEYFYHFSRQMLDAGYQPVVLVARGCGGLELTSPSLFSGKIPVDMVEAIHHIEMNYDHSTDHHQRKIFAVGYSLGAATLMNYLSLCKGFNSRVSAAVCICPPWNMNGDGYFPGYINLIWSFFLTIPLRMHYFLHHNNLVKQAPETFSNVNLWDVATAYMFAAFDEALVSVYHKMDREWLFETECKKMAVKQAHASVVSKYSSLQEYYKSVSPVTFAHEISIPTLVISAKDDPICKHEWSSPKEELSKDVLVLKTNFGGHLAFPERDSFTTSYVDLLVKNLFDRLLV